MQFTETVYIDTITALLYHFIVVYTSKKALLLVDCPAIIMLFFIPSPFAQ
jgi:hypothetical protein